MLRATLQDGVIEVETQAADANGFLRLLIDQGIGILEGREERPDLEDIFLASTEGVVS